MPHRLSTGAELLCPTMPPTRTHRVDDRVVVPVAVLAGVVAALGPAEPTGSALPDAVLVAASVAVVTWAGSTARWWALVVLAVVATAISSSPALAVAGVLAVAGALWIGTRQRDLPVPRAAVVAVSLNVAIRSEIGGFLGLTALLTVGAATMVAVSGLRRRRGNVRRGAVIAASVVGALAVLALVGAGGAAIGASGELRDGNRLAREGISMLGDGEYAAAADRFDQAADALSSSSAQLDRPWAKPAAWLPVVAQQRFRDCGPLELGGDGIGGSRCRAPRGRSGAVASGRRAFRPGCDPADRAAVRHGPGLDRRAARCDRSFRLALAGRAAGRSARRPRHRTGRQRGAGRQRRECRTAGASAAGGRRASPLLHRVHDAGGGAGPWRIHGELGGADGERWSPAVVGFREDAAN